MPVSNIPLRFPGVALKRRSFLRLAAAAPIACSTINLPFLSNGTNRQAQKVIEHTHQYAENIGLSRYGRLGDLILELKDAELRNAVIQAANKMRDGGFDVSTDSIVYRDGQSFLFAGTFLEDNYNGCAAFFDDDPLVQKRDSNNMLEGVALVAMNHVSLDMSSRLSRNTNEIKESTFPTEMNNASPEDISSFTEDFSRPLYFSTNTKDVGIDYDFKELDKITKEGHGVAGVKIQDKITKAVDWIDDVIIEFAF